LLFLRCQIVEFLPRLRWSVCIRLPVRIGVGTLRVIRSVRVTVAGGHVIPSVGISIGTRRVVRSVRFVSVRITCSSVLPSILLGASSLIPRLLARLLPSRSGILRSQRPLLLLLRPRAPALCRARPSQHRAEPYREQAPCELESKSHKLQRLIRILIRALILVLVLIRIGVACIIRLHWLRQVGQCCEIGKHVKVLESRQLLIDLRFVRRGQ
jgi:hypothetical protein